METKEFNTKRIDKILKKLIPFLDFENADIESIRDELDALLEEFTEEDENFVLDNPSDFELMRIP